ncbi:MAG: aldehyde dehydrogenase [Actinomycetota bacterium]|nr:aldehyde dehydrogenase [Actinomycetota bacterium]
MDRFVTTGEVGDRARAALARLGVDWPPRAGTGTARTPITGGPLTTVRHDDRSDVERVVAGAHAAFGNWRVVPAPVRAALVRRLATLLVNHKSDLAELASIEAGKIRSEAHGEVQEMVDICDFAVGLGRQLYGMTMTSERRAHRMMEVWQPLGVCGVITSFNFPLAVWAWNATLALVCGDAVVWKPSEKTPLTALACQALMDRAVAEEGAPLGIAMLLLGGADVGAALVDHPDVALVSATGSTPMGRVVGSRVAARLGRCLLELGGNNAAIVAPSADIALTVRAVTFAAAGTAGQRCTTLRRLIVHRSVRDEVVERLMAAYIRLPVGDPLVDGTLVGPLIDGRAYDAMRVALVELETAGGRLLCGGDRELAAVAPDAYYVRPAIASMPNQAPVVLRETFAPLLYVLDYEEWDEAVALHNAACHGLSSSLFSLSLREAEHFLSAAGSDCGIANVNIGPSGAEIGGAFGGEKDTGGGREAGSDSWKAYMRRMTCTINYSDELPLAQGVEFV